jgi:hypothetical protein
MIRGEGTELIAGVTAQEVFDFVIDPAQYTKADTKILWVTKLADTEDGMIAREDGTFLGLRFAKGSVITRYRWQAPNRIDVTLEHGVIRGMNAWFDIEETNGGTRITHIEEVDFGWGPIGWIHDALIAGWWQSSVKKEVSEIARLMREGERGGGLAAI